jgi:hypothetical protein
MLRPSGCVTQQWRCYWFRKMVRYSLRIVMFIILTSTCTLYLQLRLPVLRHTAAIALLTPATTLPCDQKNGEISTCGGETYYSDIMYLQLRHPALRHVAVVALPTPATTLSNHSIDSAHDRHACSTNSYTSYPWRRRGGPRCVTRKTARPSRDKDTNTIVTPHPWRFAPRLTRLSGQFGIPFHRRAIPTATH